MSPKPRARQPDAQENGVAKAVFGRLLFFFWRRLMAIEPTWAATPANMSVTAIMSTDPCRSLLMANALLVPAQEKSKLSAPDNTRPGLVRLLGCRSFLLETKPTARSSSSSCSCLCCSEKQRSGQQSKQVPFAVGQHSMPGPSSPMRVQGCASRMPPRRRKPSAAR